MDARRMIQSFHAFLREIGLLHALLAERSTPPPGTWSRLAEEMKRFAGLLEESVGRIDRAAEPFVVAKEFEVRSIDWMTEQSRSMAARLKAGEVNPGYAIEFLRDTVKSYIFGECFVSFRTDAAGFQDQLLKAHQAMQEHKRTLLGVELAPAAPPQKPRESNVREAAASPKASLLAIARAKLGEEIALPHPAYVGYVSLEECLKVRRTTHEFADEPLDLETVSQLLFAAQGMTDPRGFRAAPSAKASYPLEFRAVARDVEGLTPGAYLYDPFEHRLTRTLSGELGEPLAASCHHQEWVARAPLVFAVSSFVTMMFGMTLERSVECGLLEAGHATQNLLLQSSALGLAATLVGEIDLKEAPGILGLKAGQRLIYLVCVGRRP